MRWMPASIGVLFLACHPTSGASVEPTAAEPVAAEPAAVEPADPTPPEVPRAWLDKGQIRDVVRSHIEDVRRCYNVGLASDSTLAGRVEIQFTIGPTGAVAVAVIASTTLPEEYRAVAECIASATMQWTFPAPPNGGNAVVTYPFMLEPRDSLPGHAASGPRTPTRSGFEAAREVPGQWLPVLDYPPNAVAVEVLDAERKPVAGATVRLAVRLEGGTIPLEATTGADGRAVFEGIDPRASVQAGVGTRAQTETTELGGAAVGVVVVLE